MNNRADPSLERGYVDANGLRTYYEAVGLAQANVVGWSDGAVVGLLVAMQRPNLVRRLVVIGQYSNLEGLQPEMAGMLTMEQMPDVLPPMFKEAYDALSPDGPEHWPIVVDKLWTMIRTEPAIPLGDLATVSMPVLLIVAEHDMVIAGYAHAMQQAFPNARLEIVPNATHSMPREQPDVVAGLVRDFLTGADA